MALLSGGVAQATIAIGANTQDAEAGVSDLFGAITTGSAGAIGAVAGIVAAIAAIGGFLIEQAEQWHDSTVTIVSETGAQGAALGQLEDAVATASGQTIDSLQDVSAVVGLLVGRFNEAVPIAEAFAKSIGDVAVATGENGKTLASGLIDDMDKWNLSAKDQKSLLDQLVVAHQQAGTSIEDLEGALSSGAADWQAYGYSAAQALAQITAIDKTGGDANSIISGLNKSIVDIGKISDQNAQAASKNAAQAVQDAEQQRELAEQIARANQDVQNSLMGVTAAQQKYTDLINGGVERAVTDGRIKMEDATLAVADAQQKLIDSKEKLDALLKGPTEDDVAEARAKLATATAKVTAAETSLAAAQNELSDAQQRGVTGTDLAEKQDAVASANANLAQSNQDVISSTSDLNDLVDYQTTQAPAIADAKQSVADATQAVTDKQNDQIDVNAQLQDQLGDSLDGQKLLEGAFFGIVAAQQQVIDSKNSLVDAEQKHEAASAKTAAATDAEGGSYSHTQTELAKLGLTNASASDQLQGLQHWLATTSDQTDALAVSAEIYGTKKGPQMLKSLQDANKALPGVTQALKDSSGASDDLGKAADSGTGSFALAWKNLETALKPITDGVSSIIQGAMNFITLNIQAGEVAVHEFQRIWDIVWPDVEAVISGAGAVIGAIIDGIRKTFDGIVTFLEKLPGRIYGAVSGMWNFIWNELLTVTGWIEGGWNAVVTFVEGLPDDISNGVIGMWDGIKYEFEDVIDWLFREWNDFADDLGFTLPGFLGGEHIQLLPHLTAPKFHAGGVVPGSSGAEVPAILQAGETVRTTAQEAALQGALAMSASTGDSGGDTHFHFDMRGAVITSKTDFQKMVLDSLANAKRAGRTKVSA